jgi:hypothetical protein
VQRPDTGLLAGQFEFPSSIISASALAAPSAAVLHQAVDTMLAGSFADCFFAAPPTLARVSAEATALYSHGSSVQRSSCGAYLHVFSHIRQHSHVQHVHLAANDERSAAAWTPIGCVCSVQLTVNATLDEDADITDAADEDDEDGSIARPPRSAKFSASASVSRSAAAAPMHSASWVPWADLPNLGLTLSAQKIAELVVGRPLAKSATRATVTLSASNMFGGNSSTGVQATAPARSSKAASGKSKAVPDAASAESKNKKHRTQSSASSPAAAASAFFGKHSV